MALVIDATSAGSSSNSYGTLAEAETYFESRLNIAEWTAATDDYKNRALVTATRIIDQNIFLGYRYTTTQALKFPRSGIPDYDSISFTDGVVPEQIKEAQFEIALAALTSDLTESGSYGSVTVSGISFDDNSSSSAINTLSSNLLAHFTIGNGASVEVFRG